MWTKIFNIWMEAGSKMSMYAEDEGEISSLCPGNISGEAGFLLETETDPRTETLRRYSYGIILPAICMLGIIGNVLNLVVLTRKNMKGPAYIYMRGKLLWILYCMIEIIVRIFVECVQGRKICKIFGWIIRWDYYYILIILYFYIILENIYFIKIAYESIATSIKSWCWWTIYSMKFSTVKDDPLTF